MDDEPDDEGARQTGKTDRRTDAGTDARTRYMWRLYAIADLILFEPSTSS